MKKKFWDTPEGIRITIYLGIGLFLYLSFSVFKNSVVGNFTFMHFLQYLMGILGFIFFLAFIVSFFSPFKDKVKNISLMIISIVVALFFGGIANNIDKEVNKGRYEAEARREREYIEERARKESLLFDDYMKASKEYWDSVKELEKLGD